MITGRLDAIEWVRVLAACGVVWFHIAGGPYKEIGHAGLICFILISVVFQAASAQKNTAIPYLLKRLRRIIPPWLFWFALYGLYNLLKGVEFFPSSDGFVANILTGPWIGLWFFPFILLLAPLVYALSQFTTGLPRVVNAAGFQLIGIVMMMQSVKSNGDWMNEAPWIQWIHALPALPLGLALHAVLSTSGITKIVSVIVFLIVFEFVCISLLNDHPGFAISYGLAVLAVTAGFSFPFRLMPAITYLGSLCMGVYVVHSAVIAAIKILPGMESQPWTILIATLMISFFSVHLLRKDRQMVKFC